MLNDNIKLPKHKQLVQGLICVKKKHVMISTEVIFKIWDYAADETVPLFQYFKQCAKSKVKSTNNLKGIVRK